VLGYSTEAFPNGNHPKSWAQFWDVGRFPGRRTLADVASGQTHLEFALLADGVPKDRLYPLDLDRAFRSLSRIRPHVPKFWDTGALSAQMLVDKEAVAGAIWNGRLQTAIDRGAPLSMEWNENMIMVQAYSILKAAKNLENAQRFVDFAAQAEPQAEYSRQLNYGPANARAFDLMPRELGPNLPGGRASREIGFYQDADWWDVNRERVARTWARWILT
jgi:putative spermidine/putrescine transport system substrate-binding protein